MEELQKLYDVLVREGKYTKSFEEFQSKWSQDQSYQTKVYDVMSRDGFYTKDKDSFLQKYSGASTASSSTPDVVKKKGSLASATQQTQMQNTTGLPSEDGSSGMVSQRVKDKQAALTKRALDKYKDDNAAPYSSPLGKAYIGTVAVLGEMNKSVYQFADDLVVASRKSLQEEGFFDDDIPDTDTPITDAMKKKVTSKKGEILTLDPKYKERVMSDGGPLDPTPLIKGTAKLALKIINSALPQSAKNKVISALNYADAGLKNKIKEVEYLQEYALPKDNIAVNVTKGIVGMAPDLLVASLIKNPAPVKGRFAKWGTEISKDAKPLIAKYVPKATKFIEEAVKAPFTKIMAVKGSVAAVANGEEGENIVDNAIEGGFKGGLEGVYMHTLGVFAGKGTPVIAKQISRTGMNSKFATAIANPLSTAGVFTTARALRTPIETGELATGRELAEEAGFGVGFSLLHAGSLYKNQNEANHYYDNVLKTDPLESFGRVINETKDNLELVYNPDLTPSKIIELESARDQLKKAIIKEPDLNNKKLLGNEALKIQNQLDANSAIKGIVENKDAIIEAINTNENLSEEVKSEKTKKVAAIADFFDKSEFGLKKKELDTKIDDAQKSLDDASLGFTNLKKASDRVQAKIEIEKRRAELESLNTELTDLITNKETIITEKPENIDEARIKRRNENIELIKAEGSTYYEDMQLKNAKVGDEFKFNEYEDGNDRSYETKVKEIVDGKIIFENGKTQDNVSAYRNLTAEDAWFAKNHPELTLEKPKEGPPPMPEGFDVFAENKPTEEPTILDSQIPLKRETFEVELDNGVTTTVEVTTKKDGSRDFVTKADGFTSEAQKTNKDNTLSTEEYISKAYGEIKGEPKVEQGNDVMNPKMKEKLTPKQKAELGIEEPTNEIVLDIDAAEKRIAEEKAQAEAVAETKPTEEVSTQKLTEEDLPGYDRMITEAENIVKEKKRGRKKAEMYDAVMGYVTGSKVYETATDVQREALVRDVRNRFGLKEKSAPSVAKLFGKLKDVTKITMSEMKLIHNDIKMQNLGAKQVIETLNKKKAELTEATDELVRQGKITTQQASNVVKRFAKVNLLSETSVNRFTEHMAKVFNKADYAKKLTDGKVFKKDISKLSKNKDKNVNLTELGKKFAKIDPSMVENIDDYNSIAAQVKEAIKGSTKRLEKINWAGTVKIEDVSKYIDKTIEAQDLKLREEKIAELQDLMGVDAKDFSAAEIDELLRTDKKMTKDNSAIAKATIEKGFDTYSTMIKETIETGKDPFTGEDVSYKPKDVEVVKEFMDMDLGRLKDKQALAAADAVHNFLVNKSTANMENVLRQYKGPLNAKEFLTTGGKKGTGRVAQELRKYFRKDLGNFLTRKGTPMGGVFVKLFKGVEAGTEFARLSGFSEIQKGKNYALTAVKNISNDYIKKFFTKKANGEKFNTAYNEAERGIVADLRRSTPGNEATEFKRRVDILDQSIKELEKGTPEEVKKAELYQKVYDKVVEGSKDLSDVESKTDKLNLEAIEFWQNQHELYFDDLANYMLNVHNTVLEKGVNYASPDRYASLSEEAPAKLLDNEAMYGAGGEHLYKKEASGLMKAQYPKDLPQGRYRDYSFDKNNVNSMKDALVDMNTGGAIRQLEAFRESAEYKKIIPSIFDRNMVNKRMTDYVSNTRNKGDYGVEDSKLIKALDKIATIGAGMVLGSPLQAIKQTIPIIPNTIINAGKVGFTGAFNPKFNNFLNESGYATGLRGVESQLEISSLNKKIELAAEGTPAQLGKAIENANKWWLKTFLVKPDVFIARSSWQAYYEQSLERQGISTKGLDYGDHKINEKAGDYAEEMVSRQQNVSDHDLAGEWFTKNTADAKILKKLFLNMASFRMNQSARVGADLTTLEHWNTSTTSDKITAARSLAGYGAEMVTFRVLSAAAILAIGSLAKKIKGEEESDVDWEERFNSVLKGQLTSSVVDTFSPAPFLDMGVKAILSPASEKLEEVTGLPLSIYGVQKEDWLQQLGAYGMAPQRLYQIEQAAELAFTGTYKDEYGNVKKISEEDQKVIKELLPFYAATGLGILPTDVATGIRDVVKFSKKKVTTDQEVLDAEIALEEKEENVDEKLDALKELSKQRLNPKLQKALKEKIDELSVEDPEEKKQLVLERKEEREAKELLLVDPKNGKVYDNESDLKKYNRRLWLKNFGPRSKWGKEHKYEKEIDSKLEKKLTKDEEVENNYRKSTNSDGSSKRRYGSSSYGSSSYGSSSYGSSSYGNSSSKSERYDSNGVLTTTTRTSSRKSN